MITFLLITLILVGVAVVGSQILLCAEVRGVGDRIAEARDSLTLLVQAKGAEMEIARLKEASRATGGRQLLQAALEKRKQAEAQPPAHHQV